MAVHAARGAEKDWERVRLSYRAKSVDAPSDKPIMKDRMQA